MQKDVPPPPLPMDMSELFIENRVCVRLYLLRAYNLPPMDLNGSTDSYPEIELAGKVVPDIESKAPTLSSTSTPTTTRRTSSTRPSRARATSR